VRVRQLKNRIDFGFWRSVMLLMLAAILPSGPVRSENADAAKQQFLTSCGTCHTAEKGAAPRQGPDLATVYGRHVAVLPDFKYSDALTAGNWIWTETTLDPWIENAQAAHPGTVMNYRQSNPDKRRLIIGYLKSLAETG
jgi:cytochrome c